MPEPYVHSVPYVPLTIPALSLTIKAGPGEGRVIPCRRVVTLIGSRPGCKINLHHENVAPVHLALVNAGNDIWLRDLVSPRGTRLNGLPLEHEKAEDGHIISLGPWEIRVDIQPPQRSQDADVHALSLEPSPEAVVLEHVASRRVLKSRREVCVIGRRPGCDIVVSDPSVSRCHALLFSYMGRPAVCDLLTANTMRVNGVPAGFRVLSDGDVLSVGDTEFKTRIHESPLVKRNGGNGTGRNGSGGHSEVTIERQAPADLIDIRQAESNRRWVVADNLERAQRGSA